MECVIPIVIGLSVKWIVNFGIKVTLQVYLFTEGSGAISSLEARLDFPRFLFYLNIFSKMKRRTIENLNRKDVGRTSVFPSLVSLGGFDRWKCMYFLFLIYIYIEIIQFSRR